VICSDSTPSFAKVGRSWYAEARILSALMFTNPTMPTFNRKRHKEPAIVVPKPSEDRPKFGRVGIIAGVGFVVGVAWPGLARLELVPRPPNEGVRAPAASASAVAGAAIASADGQNTASGPGVAAAAPNPKKSESVVKSTPKVRLAEIVNCVDADGKKHRRCGELKLDSLVTEPLRSLVACDGVAGQTGVLSLGFDVDFGAQKLGGFTVGRSTTLSAPVAKELRGCAENVLGKLELGGIEHGFSNYRVFYLVEFASAGSAGDGADSPDVPATPMPAASGTGEGTSAEVQGASGRATVSWEVALVRKAPRDGAVVARVLGGTRLMVTGRQGDWYRVKYDAQGNEGFVFKSAIGL